MKRKRSVFLSLLCMLCCLALLSACNRTVEYPEESSTPEVSRGPDKYGRWSIDDLVQGEIAFPIEGLYGQTEETLKQNYPAAIYEFQSITMVDTPLNALIYGVGSELIPYLYDKRTGTFSLACNDPLCTHENCIWSQSYFQTYAGSDRLFFTLWSDEALDTIYDSDLYGNNLHKLYQSDGNNVGRLTAEGEYLYFLEDLHDKELDAVKKLLIRVPLNGGPAEKVIENVVFYMPLGDKILYVDQEDTHCYLYTVETGKKVLFEQTAHPVATYQGWLYYYTDDAFYRVSLENLEEREKIFDHICQCLIFSENRIYYLRRSHFSESEEYGNYWKYDLYAANLDGSAPTYIHAFETDGIPDRVSWMWGDGKMLIFKYQSYLDFENEFNPNFNLLNHPHHYTLLDLSTGEQIMID